MTLYLSRKVLINYFKVTESVIAELRQTTDLTENSQTVDKKRDKRRR